MQIITKPTSTKARQSKKRTRESIWRYFFCLDSFSASSSGIPPLNIHIEFKWCLLLRSGVCLAQEVAPTATGGMVPLGGWIWRRDLSTPAALGWHLQGASPGPFQCSCVENSMNRGDWWATVHGITKNQTRLSDFHSFTPSLIYNWASLVAQMVKRLPVMWETWVWPLGQEDPLEKEMATYSSTFAWKIPWM